MRPPAVSLCALFFPGIAGVSGRARRSRAERPLSLRSPWTVAALGLPSPCRSARDRCCRTAGPVGLPAPRGRPPRPGGSRVLQPALRVPPPGLLLLGQRAGLRHRPRRGRWSVDRDRPGGRRRPSSCWPGVPAPEGRLQRRRRGPRGLRRGRRAAAACRSATSPRPPPGSPTWSPSSWPPARCLLFAAAITATQGYPGRSLWTSLLVPVLLVGPVAVLVGLAILLLISVTAGPGC